MSGTKEVSVSPQMVQVRENHDDDTTKAAINAISKQLEKLAQRREKALGSRERSKEELAKVERGRFNSQTESHRAVLRADIRRFEAKVEEIDGEIGELQLQLEAKWREFVSKLPGQT